MAVIYLRHDKHGTKVACSDGEAAADCANGWQRFSLDEPVVEKGFPVDTPLNAFLAVEKVTDDGVTTIEQLRARYSRDAFDMLWAEGAKTPKMMSVGLHMRLIGHPARAMGLQRLLDAGVVRVIERRTRPR